MISVSALIVLLVLCLIIWAWQASSRAREIATLASKKACDKLNIQFLDGTTSLTKIRLQRAPSGLVSIKRHFSFDFYDGIERSQGHTVVFCNRVVSVDILSKDIPQTPTAVERKTAANDSSNVIPFKPRDK